MRGCAIGSLHAHSVERGLDWTPADIGNNYQFKHSYFHRLYMIVLELFGGSSRTESPLLAQEFSKALSFFERLQDKFLRAIVGGFAEPQLYSMDQLRTVEYETDRLFACGRGAPTDFCMRARQQRGFHWIVLILRGDLNRGEFFDVQPRAAVG